MVVLGSGDPGSRLEMLLVLLTPTVQCESRNSTTFLTAGHAQLQGPMLFSTSNTAAPKVFHRESGAPNKNFLLAATSVINASVSPLFHFSSLPLFDGEMIIFVIFTRGRLSCAQFHTIFQLFLHFFSSDVQAVQQEEVISNQSGVHILLDARRQLIMKPFRG